MSDRDPAFSHSAKFPYDASDDWWEGNGETPPPAGDWAHATARAVVANLKDRRGIKHGFSGIDEAVRFELVQSLANIIRTGAQTKDKI